MKLKLSHLGKKSYSMVRKIWLKEKKNLWVENLDVEQFMHMNELDNVIAHRFEKFIQKPKLDLKRPYH